MNIARNCKLCIAWASVCLSSLAWAQPVTIWQHRLTVAANPLTLVDNVEVDAILDGMNAIIRASRYGDPWDAACPEIEFIRTGDVILDKQLPTIGTFDELEAALKKVVPKANVLIALGINCTGITAAGCGRVGSEPLVVGLYPGFDDQLWLHERGHNVGLQHSAEAPADDASIGDEIGKRFMFWALGDGHVGKTHSDCASFKSSKFASIVKQDNVSSPGTPAIAATIKTAEMIGARSENTSAATEEKLAGMTPAAYRVIAPPWLHGVPVDALKRLNEKDVESIRTMLRGNVNQYWPQALTALATIGREDDADLIKRALDLPVAAVTGDMARANRDQFRNVLRSKLTAPSALGILANRTKSSAAVDMLKNAVTIDSARTIVGTESADVFSKQVLHGLSLANTPESKIFMNSVLDKPEGAPGPNVVPLTGLDAAQLRQNTIEIDRHGVDVFLKQRSEPLR